MGMPRAKNKDIQVVLKQKVPGMGEAGEVIKVKPAYWENVLYRQDLAAPAMAEVLERIAEEVAAREAQLAAVKKEAQEKESKMTSAFGQKGCMIEKKVGPSGEIFGSVTPIELSLILENKCGFVVDKKDMVIDKITATPGLELPAMKAGETPVKVAGETTATITLHKEVKAKLKIVIVPEK